MASDKLQRTAIEMNDAVESISAAQAILDYLETHRRQSLLLDLRSRMERDALRHSSEEELIHSLRDIHAYVTSAREDELVRQASKTITEYLAFSNRLHAQGVAGLKLYASTANAFEIAITDVSALVKYNEQVARSLESTATWQSSSYKSWSIIFLLTIVSVLALILWFFHRLIFLPVMKLKREIESYSMTQATPNAPMHALTEIKEISQAFRELVLTLRRQNEQRLIFLSAVAHDIKNPLGAIQMSIDLLSDPSVGKLENAKLTAVIKRQVHQLKRLVEDLLDASRIEAGHLELKNATEDLGGLLSDSAVLFNSVSEKHPLVIELPKESLFVHGDGTRLCQVFNNILSNAIKYSPAGGEVKVELTHTGEFAIVQISDNGIGIDAAEFNHIFEPFRRPSASQHHIPGVGLGLSTSKRIIEAHRGWIRVQSRIGHGTKFLLTLPLFRKGNGREVIESKEEVGHDTR